MNRPNASGKQRPEAVDEQIDAGLCNYDAIFEASELTAEQEHTQHIRICTDSHSREYSLKRRPIKSPDGQKLYSIFFSLFWNVFQFCHLQIGTKNYTNDGGLWFGTCLIPFLNVVLSLWKYFSPFWITCGIQSDTDCFDEFSRYLNHYFMSLKLLNAVSASEYR